MKITRRDFLFLSGMSPILLSKKGHGLENSSFQALQTTKSSRFDPWLELNLDHLGWNLDKLRKKAKVPIMAVIKANGYGHGLLPIAQYLEKKAVDYLMVGKIEEALILRESGIKSPLLNFGPFSAENAEAIVIHNISQSVFTSEINHLNSAAFKLNKKAKIHLHIDTGLGRSGIPYYQAPPFIEMVASLPGIKIEGISTTLTEDSNFDRLQLKRFLSLCHKIEKKGIPLGLKHAASSSGLLNMPSSCLDMVRPGITLYGYYPSEETQKEDSLSLRQVLQLKARIYSVKDLRPGDSVSYHRAYTAQKKEKIALLPLGYSDGYPSNVIGRASILVRGQRFPLIGNVTANHTEILLDSAFDISPGEEVVFIGSHGKDKITAAELASWAGTSTYKILLGLNPFLPKKLLT